jgi:hypothetical protein
MRAFFLFNSYSCLSHDVLCPIRLFRVVLLRPRLVRRTKIIPYSLLRYFEIIFTTVTRASPWRSPPRAARLVADPGIR